MRPALIVPNLDNQLQVRFRDDYVVLTELSASGATEYTSIDLALSVAERLPEMLAILRQMEAQS